MLSELNTAKTWWAIRWLSNGQNLKWTGVTTETATVVEITAEGRDRLSATSVARGVILRASVAIDAALAGIAWAEIEMAVGIDDETEVAIGAVTEAEIEVVIEVATEG